MPETPDITEEQALDALVAHRLAGIKKRNEHLRKRHAWCQQHVDTLLEMVPHSASSCKDDPWSNEYNDHNTGDTQKTCQCSRCQLLYIKDCGYDNEEWVIDIGLRRVETENEDEGEIRSRIKRA